MVQEYKTVDSKIKGKLCHFQKKDFMFHDLMDFYWKKPEEININRLKDKMVEILEEEGFVFFNEIEYKYITYFGKLVEFAVNFKHIK